MATERKHKKKVWWQLAHAKCPKCNTELQKGMFDANFVSCPNVPECGFTINEDVKNLLVKRDHE